MNNPLTRLSQYHCFWQIFWENVMWGTDFLAQLIWQTGMHTYKLCYNKQTIAKLKYSLFQVNTQTSNWDIQ